MIVVIENKNLINCRHRPSQLGAGSAGAKNRILNPHSAVRKYKRILITVSLQATGAGGQTHTIPVSGGIVAI